MKSLFIAGLIAFSLTAVSSANAATTLRAGSVLPASSDQGQAAEFFAKRVSELTKGDLVIQVFHSGEIGTPPVQFENLIAGAQDMVIDTTDYLASYDKRMGILNTPFVFRSRQHLQTFLRSEAFTQLKNSVEGQGMVFLSDYNWMRQQNRGLVTRTPIVKPEDLRGYKLRMFQAEIPIRAWSEMGANVQVIAWGELYTALVTGTVDGLTGPLAASYLSKHTEILKNFTDLEEYYQIVLPVVSKVTWDKLTDEHKAALRQASNEAGEEYVRLSKQQNDQDIAKAVNEHGVKLIEADMDAWHARAKDLHKTLIEADMLDASLVEAIAALQ